MGHNLLQYVVVVFIAVAAILGHSSGRGLRPSDHGLAYQEDSLAPAQSGSTQEMKSFFGATTSTSVELPEAKNISDTWMSARAEGGARDVGRDHVRLGLLVASAACGLTGVILLAISGVVFLIRLHRLRPKAGEVSATSALTSLPQNDAANNQSTMLSASGNN